MLLSFDYVRARSKDDAVNLAVEAGPNGRFLAGGTDLFVRMYDRQLRLKTLIDVKEIEGIEGMECQNGQGLSIGAASSLNMLVGNETIRSRYGLLAQAAHSVGSLQVRNRASIGGNICNASPAADTAPALLVYDAEIETWGPRNTRLIPIGQFFTGPGKTVLEHGEFVYKIRIPEPDTRSYGVYLKLGRTNSVDLSIVSVACLALASGEVRIALGAVAPTPIRVTEAESILLSRKDEEAIAFAASAAKETAVPISDVRAGEEYRLDMVEVLTKNAIEQALAGLAATGEV